jgi:hypothetical protein
VARNYTEGGRLKSLLEHIRAASAPAGQEASVHEAEQELGAMAQAFREAAQVNNPKGEISKAFDELATNLLRAGIPLRADNGIYSHEQHSEQGRK